MIPGMNNKMIKAMSEIGNETSKSMKQIADNMDELNSKQDEIILALATIYDALKVISKQQGVSLPKQRINMDIENMEGRTQ